MIETIRKLLNDNPALVVAVTMCVVWPTASAFLSLAQETIARRWPRVWAALSAAGLDLPKLLRVLSGGRAPDVRPPTPATVYRSALGGEGRDTLEQERLEKAYAAYVRSSAGKNREGLPLPSWFELSPEARESYAAFGRTLQNELDRVREGGAT